MTPDELRVIIHQLGLSQEGLGCALGVSGRTVRNWLSGKHKVPRSIELLLSAEGRTIGYLRTWLKNDEFRAAVRRQDR